MKPKLKHSPQRTQWVTGHIAAKHGDVPHEKLQAIVADALEGALIHDHDDATTRRPGRADSAPAGIRTDGGKTMTTRDPKREAADRQRAKQDEALADIRGQHKRSKGYTKADARAGNPAVANPERAPAPKADADADSVADLIRNAHKRNRNHV